MPRFTMAPLESARNWRTLQKALKSGALDVAADAAEKLIDDSCREAVKNSKRVRLPQTRAYSALETVHTCRGRDGSRQ